jgi:MSHA pilin protein MshC
VHRLRPAGPAGFTMVELIVVIVLIGILGAIAGSRLFDNQVFEARAYADQSRSLIRYAQKLAIAQNRAVFVRSTPNGFAVCFIATCATAADLAQAPGSSNNGSTATREFCVGANGQYVANWACLGRPATVVIASTVQRAEMAANGFFYFDRAGRPFNSSDTGASTFTRLTLNFSSGAQTATLNVEAETGYVF